MWESTVLWYKDDADRNETDSQHHPFSISLFSKMKPKQSINSIFNWGLYNFCFEKSLNHYLTNKKIKYYLDWHDTYQANRVLAWSVEVPNSTE